MDLDVVRDKYWRDINDSVRSSHANLAIAHRFPRRTAHTQASRAHDYRRIRTELTPVISAIEIFRRPNQAAKGVDEGFRDGSHRENVRA
jgi:hypothetical protein